MSSILPPYQRLPPDEEEVLDSWRKSPLASDEEAAPLPSYPPGTGSPSDQSVVTFILVPRWPVKEKKDRVLGFKGSDNAVSKSCQPLASPHDCLTNPLSPLSLLFFAHLATLNFVAGCSSRNAPQIWIRCLRHHQKTRATVLRAFPFLAAYPTDRIRAPLPGESGRQRSTCENGWSRILDETWDKLYKGFAGEEEGADCGWSE